MTRYELWKVLETTNVRLNVTIYRVCHNYPPSPKLLNDLTHVYRVIESTFWEFRPLPHNRVCGGLEETRKFYMLFPYRVTPSFLSHKNTDQILCVLNIFAMPQSKMVAKYVYRSQHIIVYYNKKIVFFLAYTF